MTEPNFRKEISSIQDPWVNNQEAVWLGFTYQVSRNLEKFHFPHKLNIDKRLQLLSLISKQLLNIKELKSPTFFPAEILNPFEKEFLSEHFLLPTSLQQASQGEAILIDTTGRHLITLNLGDHFRIVFLDCNGELEKAWNHVMSIESTVGSAFPYAFSPKFGFLTADPTNCGTALTISSFLQIPALIHTGEIDTFLEGQKDENLTVTGLSGNPTELVGDCIVLQNTFKLGLSEEALLSTIRIFTTKIHALEKALREKIKKEESGQIKDRVARAFAILMHSYQIEVAEALNALSLLKLGLDLGWCKGTTFRDLNALFLKCQRSHLIQATKEKIAHEAIPHARAAFIHAKLKGVELLV